MDKLQARIQRQQQKSKCWANPEQALLLNACLFQGERAITAWKAWRDAVNFEAIDLGSYRLLPQLYRNLSAQGITDPLLTRCKGIYRKTWYDNQLRLHTLNALCQQFDEAGIPTLIFKGAALTLQYCQDYGIRPMSDIDLLIPASDLARAEALLQRLGWQSENGVTGLARLVRAVHAYSFRNEQGQNLDLHWHLLLSNLQDHADDDFWKFSIPLHEIPLATRILSPTDQLLCICIHGLRWNGFASIRWIADAFAIVQRAGSEIDWPRLIHYANRYQSVIVLREAFRYLQDQFAIPMPAFVLQALEAVSPAPVEQSIYLATLRPPTLAAPEQMMIADQVLSSVTADRLSNYGYKLDHSFAARPDRSRMRLGILSDGIATADEIPSINELLAKFNQDEFEVFIYLTGFDLQPQSLEVECQSCVERLSVLPVAPVFYIPDDQSLWTSVETIRSDDLDGLLITGSLSDVSFTRLLALHRLAPVQVAWVASPVLTAIDAVDYALYSNPELLNSVAVENQPKYLHTSLETIGDQFKDLSQSIGIRPQWVNLPPVLNQAEPKYMKLDIYLQRVRENLEQIRSNYSKIL